MIDILLLMFCKGLKPQASGVLPAGCRIENGDFNHG